jgi:hypothetical protein
MSILMCTPAEKSIVDAIREVQNLGCDDSLSPAIEDLRSALDLVIDHAEKNHIAPNIYHSLSSAAPVNIVSGPTSWSAGEHND